VRGTIPTIRSTEGGTEMLPIPIKSHPTALGDGGPIAVPREATHPGEDSRRLSRRAFLGRSGLLAAAAALTPEFLARHAWAQAPPGPPDLTTDTINGLVAFIVPGPDDYSLHQGVSTPEPGGIAANAAAALIFTFDLVELAPPPFQAFSDLIGFVLNNVALANNPGSGVGPFQSPFANLTFAEKVTVFGALESGAVDPALVPLAGLLPVFVAFTVYSEAGVFDPAAHAPVARPVGWTISGYEGVADGRDEFKGYFQNRRKVTG
jgi:hypothetical protein